MDYKGAAHRNIKTVQFSDIFERNLLEPFFL